MAPDLSVIILSWNTRELLSECLQAVGRTHGGLALETIVIDNGSADGSGDLVAGSYPGVRLVRNERNEGYARGVNQGLALATGRKICLLGSDTRVAPDALPRLCAFLDERPEAGAVAPRLVNPDGTTQRTCMRFPRFLTALWWDTFPASWSPGRGELARYQYLDWDHRGSREVEQPPGTCVVVPADVVRAIGPMDQRLWLFFNDVDWLLRIRRLGRTAWYLDDVEVMHHLGASTRKYGDFAGEWHRNRIAFWRKHWGLPGALLTKTVLLGVALRQCFRIRSELGSWEAAAPHTRTIRTEVRKILLSG